MQGKGGLCTKVKISFDLTKRDAKHEPQQKLSSNRQLPVPSALDARVFTLQFIFYFDDLIITPRIRFVKNYCKTRVLQGDVKRIYTILSTLFL